MVQVDGVVRHSRRNGIGTHSLRQRNDGTAKNGVGTDFPGLPRSSRTGFSVWDKCKIEKQQRPKRELGVSGCSTAYHRLHTLTRENKVSKRVAQGDRESYCSTPSEHSVLRHGRVFQVAWYIWDDDAWRADQRSQFLSIEYPINSVTVIAFLHHAFLNLYPMGTIFKRSVPCKYL